MVCVYICVYVSVKGFVLSIIYSAVIVAALAEAVVSVIGLRYRVQELTRRGKPNRYILVGLAKPVPVS